MLSEQHDDGILTDEEYKTVKNQLVVYLFHNYPPEVYKYIEGMKRLKKGEKALMEEMGIRQPK